MEKKLVHVFNKEVLDSRISDLDYVMDEFFKQKAVPRFHSGFEYYLKALISDETYLNTEQTDQVIKLVGIVETVAGQVTENYVFDAIFHSEVIQSYKDMFTESDLPVLESIDWIDYSEEVLTFRVFNEDVIWEVVRV